MIDLNSNKIRNTFVAVGIGLLALSLYEMNKCALEFKEIKKANCGKKLDVKG